MQKQSEVVAVGWIEGILEVPPTVLPLVQEYRRLAELTKFEAYPRAVDDKMNKIFDVLEVMA